MIGGKFRLVTTQKKSPSCSHPGILNPDQFRDKMTDLSLSAFSLCVLHQCVLCVLGFNELKLAVVRSMPLTGPNKEKKLPQL